VSVTAYHSFSGEVEASNTPTIRRLTPSRRHQLPRIAHVERSNLSFRMHMRRFTRLTNSHSKKFENHCHMVALYTVWHNFVRTNKAVPMPPALAVGIADHAWKMAEIVKLIDDAAPALQARGPYKKRAKLPGAVPNPQSYSN
jgi:hypothetical protein